MTVGHIPCYVQDLMALDCIPDMIRAGVSCFKIEGRLKGPEYVAITTAAYRAAVDRAWADFASQPKQALQSEPVGVSAEQRRFLHQVCGYQSRSLLFSSPFI